MMGDGFFPLVSEIVFVHLKLFGTLQLGACMHNYYRLGFKKITESDNLHDCIHNHDCSSKNIY